MKVLKMSSAKLDNIYNSHSSIGSGSVGEIVEYDDETLIKLYYARVFGNFLIFDYLYDDIDSSFISKNQNRKNLERLKLLMERQSSVKMTNLPTGIIITRNYLTGILMKYLKDYKTLSELDKVLTTKDKIIILETVREKFVELKQNYIYPRDLWQKNVMMHPITKDIQLIDLDDECTVVKNCYDKRSDFESEFAFDEFTKIMSI